jgi:hypothetical protein
VIRSPADWLLLATVLASFSGLVWLLSRSRTEPPSFSSRGEEAGVPEERDDEMAVGRAAGVEPQPPVAPCWDLWEEQCYSLEPVVERVARIKEGRR